jgi:hypothetical protein
MKKMINEISADCYNVVTGWIEEDWYCKKTVEDYLQYGIKEEYEEFVNSLAEDADEGNTDDYEALMKELRRAVAAANKQAM